MIIGLTGRAQAGKDTVCERLAAVAPGVVVRHAFADKLYEAAAASLGVTPAQLREWKTDPRVRIEVAREWETDSGAYDIEVSITARQYLQRFGAEGHRDVFGPDFWANQVKPPSFDDRLHVVTDVRFENEARHLIDRGGFIVRVFGTPEVEDVRDEHVSEAGLSGEYVTAVLYNGCRDDGFKSLDRQLATLLPRLTALHQKNYAAGVLAGEWF